MAFPSDTKEEHQVEHSTNATSTDDMNIKNSDIIQAETLAAELKSGTSQAEKDLVRKLDWRILPCVWILYLLGFLDRANVGYMKLSTVTTGSVANTPTEMPKPVVWKMISI